LIGIRSEHFPTTSGRGCSTTIDECVQEEYKSLSIAIEITTLLPFNIPTNAIGNARAAAMNEVKVETLCEGRMRDEGIPMSEELMNGLIIHSLPSVAEAV
jgi:hypothetical protein